MSSPNPELKRLILEYFNSQNYSSKKNLGEEVRARSEYLFKSCEFVYVSKDGTTLHANRHCGSGFLEPVPFDVAVSFGYKNVCKNCACGTFVEDLAQKMYYHDGPKYIK